MKLYLTALLMLSLIFCSCKSNTTEAPVQTSTTFKMTTADYKSLPFSVKYINTSYADTVWVSIGNEGSITKTISTSQPSSNTLKIRFLYGWGQRSGGEQQAAGKYFDTGNLPFSKSGDTLLVKYGQNYYQVKESADSLSMQIFLMNEDFKTSRLGHTFLLSFKK